MSGTKLHRDVTGRGRRNGVARYLHVSCTGYLARRDDVDCRAGRFRVVVHARCGYRYRHALRAGGATKLPLTSTVPADAVQERLTFHSSRSL